TPFLDQREQIAEVAHAPVALGTHAVQLHGRAPYLAAVAQRVGHVARGRCDDERRFAERLAVTQYAQAVIAERRVDFEHEFARDSPIITAFAFVQMRRPEFAMVCTPALLLRELPVQGDILQHRMQIEAYAPWPLRGAYDDRRRQHACPAFALRLAQCGL